MGSTSSPWSLRYLKYDGTEKTLEHAAKILHRIKYNAISCTSRTSVQCYFCYLSLDSLPLSLPSLECNTLYKTPVMVIFKPLILPFCFVGSILANCKCGQNNEKIHSQNWKGNVTDAKLTLKYHGHLDRAK